MPTASLALSSQLSRRVVKLAQAAGQTPESMLRLVIRDGLDYCEYAVKSVNEGLADIEAGRAYSGEDVREHFAKRCRTTLRHSRDLRNPAAGLELPPSHQRQLFSVASTSAPGLAPAGDLLSCSRKKVGKEALPAAPALRAPLAAEGPPGRSLN